MAKVTLPPEEPQEPTPQQADAEAKKKLEANPDWCVAELRRGIGIRDRETGAIDRYAKRVFLRIPTARDLIERDAEIAKLMRSDDERLRQEAESMTLAQVLLIQRCIVEVPGLLGKPSRQEMMDLARIDVLIMNAAIEEAEDALEYQMVASGNSSTPPPSASP